MKKIFLFVVACCSFGLMAQAQSVPDLMREQAGSDADVDSTAPPAMGLPTQKGSSMIGCNIVFAGLDAVELRDERSMHYRVGMSPRFAWFVANNFAVGADVNLSIDGYTRVNQYTIQAGAGAFGRLYTGKAATRNGELHKFRFFIEGGLGYGYLFDRTGDALGGGDASLDYGVLQIHGMPGINYFANRNVAFELGLNYGYQHTVLNEDIMKDDHHSLLLSIGVQVFFVKR